MKLKVEVGNMNLIIIGRLRSRRLLRTDNLLEPRRRDEIKLEIIGNITARSHALIVQRNRDSASILQSEMRVAHAIRKMFIPTLKSSNPITALTKLYLNITIALIAKEIVSVIAVISRA
jgi:hypothetical protein